jgi:hypothetical protein
MQITIGSESDHRLILRPVKRAEETDQIVFDIEAVAGSFLATTSVPLKIGLLADMATAMRGLHETLRGEFTLTSSCREIWVSITGNGNGDFAAHCTMRDTCRSYTQLKFDAVFDTGGLDGMIGDLEEILSAFPTDQ